MITHTQNNRKSLDRLTNTIVINIIHPHANKTNNNKLMFIVHVELSPNIKQNGRKDM